MPSSPDLPTRNGFQRSYDGGDFDGFVAALSSDGQAVLRFVRRR